MKGIPSCLAAPRALTITVMQLKQNQLTLHAIKARMLGFVFVFFPGHGNPKRQGTHRTSVMLCAKSSDDGVTVPQSDQARTRYAGPTLGSSARRNPPNKIKHLSRAPSHPPSPAPLQQELSSPAASTGRAGPSTPPPPGCGDAAGRDQAAQGARPGPPRLFHRKGRCRRPRSTPQAPPAGAARLPPRPAGAAGSPAGPRQPPQPPRLPPAALCRPAGPEGALRRRQEHYSGHKRAG